MDVPVEVSAGPLAVTGAGAGGGAANVKPAKNPALQRMICEALLLLEETEGRAEMTEMLLFNWGEGGAGGAGGGAQMDARTMCRG